MKNITFTDSELKAAIELYESEIDRAQRRINSLQDLIKKMRAESPAGEKKAAKAEKAEKAAPKAEKAAKAAKAEPAAKPAKRGRPAKAKTAEATKALAEAAPAAAPKKRGRKPKAVAAPLAAPTKAKATAAKKATTKKTTAKKTRKAASKTPKARPTRYQAIKGHGGVKMKWTDTILGVIKENAAPMTSAEIASRTIELMGIESKDADRAKTAVATNLSKMVKDKVLTKSKSTGMRGSVYSAPNTSVVVNNTEISAPSYPTYPYNQQQ